MKTIRIGTRNSELALWQAYYVRDALKAIHDDLQVELVEIVSEGDRTLDIPLHQAGGKGLFLKELELALLDGSIDLAVHSMKDVTITLPEGLHISVYCPREDPSDAFVSNACAGLEDMSEGSIVGTCSLRRQSQIRWKFPHLQLKNLRGNVNSRLRKLDEGQYDAIILASAGLMRLDMEHRITQRIDSTICLPAVGQGIVGVESRMNDDAVNSLIKPMNDRESSIRVTAERATNERLGGGCHAPIAVFCEIGDNDNLTLRGRVGELDGSRIIHCELAGHIDSPADLGRRLADDLLAQGAAVILESIPLI
jgi:hydroxymethylbilane synthase